MKRLYARDTLYNSKALAHQYFKEYLFDDKYYDYQFTGVNLKNLMVIGNFVFQIPAFREFYKSEIIGGFLNGLPKEESHFFQIDWESEQILYYVYSNGNTVKNVLDKGIQVLMLQLLSNYTNWVGYLNTNGDHIIDLKKPSPSPHFSTNMLLGNRIDFPHPLQTTPKSVVDRFGGGSFRSHAATQVLATRWDMLPEENGFPANRQFYLLEKGKQIFYSANVTDKNIKSAICKHSNNYTEIEYITECGLHIKRRIFLLPGYEELPIATEVQRITITNNSQSKRNLKIVMTGMMGSPAPGAFMEDVVYSTIIMESSMLQNQNGDFMAYVPHYYPDYCQRDIRFMSGMIYIKGNKSFPEEIGTHYSDFIGNGNLYYPQGVMKLSNKLSVKGPAFISLGKEFVIDNGEDVIADQYAGLISLLGDEVSEESIFTEVQELHNKFINSDVLDKCFAEHMNWYAQYKSYLSVDSQKNIYNEYINNNLPFQVLYQTFVSRSFDLTQKGYREIGFREIQDIYASMYYFMSMGKEEFVKELLIQWIEKVFELGYCYHNFFWSGKEPGKWSDDGLWLIQAVYRYIQFARDTKFLEELHDIPETNGKKRSVYDTLKAIVHYSSKISIGKHGLPLIDFADWNDCLKVDPKYLSGKDKENLEGPVDYYSESVMNGFLLKVAMTQLNELAMLLKDSDYQRELKIDINTLSQSLQTNCWKEDFFARVLFNRFGEDITYLGAKNDGFSSDYNIDGTYFLNSFSWSILSGEATEQQIEIMLDQVEKYLKKPFGFVLMSPTDLSRVSKSTATGEYFPGDRENGGIFKHASMMSSSAMIKAAKEVQNQELAIRLRDLAYWMVDMALPYNTLGNPYELCGNPRWCTQYINSYTGEHIGPTLSGTSSWLTLTLFEMLGIEYQGDKLILNPLLSNEEEAIEFTLRYLESYYIISIRKPKGLYRLKDFDYTITLDDELLEDNRINLKNDGRRHYIKMEFN
ncbi:MAG TPA: glycosyl transferase [Mobilitalea sp.]|nr:glycosyl transferase [Mobilitalea sp.]